ncbi:MAG: Bcr/CflA family efflux MFS transporter [Pedobacter sp.]|nr:MAG: Bcr/CflA family efflux MFS transporter [Pedobacter sp.]
MKDKALLPNNGLTNHDGNNNPAKLTKKEVTITVVLALLTAIEILSVDLYLPAFKAIADDFRASLGDVQLSLSIFLGGFALGQLVWGTLADRFGRKLPIIVGLFLYVVFSLVITSIHNVGMFWLLRFLQAFCGSAGVVIARAIVSDVFDRHKTIKVFSLLGLIMGVTPIIAPSIGNMLLGSGTWHTNFVAMAATGMIVLVLVVLLLPETHLIRNTDANQAHRNKYKPIFENRQFITYTLTASMVYAGLLVFVSNSPFLIMEKGQFTGTEYSLIFGLISVGIVFGSYSINYLVKYFDKHVIVKCVALLQALFALFSVIMVLFGAPVPGLLILIFFYLFLLGILLPATADLALEPFRSDSGKASAIFGFVQLAVTFVILTIIGLVQDDSIMPMTVALLMCAVVSLVSSWFRGWKTKAS